MEESLKDLNVNFVNVIAKNIPRPDGKIEKVKGEKQLLNLTLNKCNEVLKGGMPKIMMENISNEINKKMKRNIGKNSLIKYMLKLDDSDLKKVPKKDFRAYQSDSIPYLRLIKYKGIGYGELNDVERIKKKTLEYIKEQTKKTNYNDFIHCIWYIIKGQRAEDGEIKYLKELKKAYINVHIPLVIIYLNEYGDGKIKKWKKVLKI